MKQASLYFGTGRVLMLAPYPQGRPHSLAVLKMILALDQPFSIRIENGDWQEAQAILLDANVTHQLRHAGDYQATIMLVPERRRGVQLQKTLLCDSKVRSLDDWNLETYRKSLLTCLKKRYDCRRAFQIAVDLLDHLNGLTQNRSSVDARILATVDAIQASLAEHISASALARNACLSEDRFLHLFKEQLGLPLRSYILYQRVLLATREFLGGKSLTEAAHFAGFSDSAHFSRTFAEMNGLPPSHFSKRSREFEVFFCTKLSWL